MQVNIYEAKTRLSQLLLDVQNGEEVIIARNGIPVAKLVKFDGPVIRQKKDEVSEEKEVCPGS